MDGYPLSSALFYIVFIYQPQGLDKGKLLLAEEYVEWGKEEIS